MFFMFFIFGGGVYSLETGSQKILDVRFNSKLKQMDRLIDAKDRQYDNDSKEDQAIKHEREVPSLKSMRKSESSTICSCRQGRR